jgi:hypothetical protein
MDCRYHKFLELLNAALAYGVTTSATPREKKTQEVFKVEPSKGNQINIAVTSTASSGTANESEKKDIKVCFDKTIAAKYNNYIRYGCEDEQPGKQKTKGGLQTELGDYDESMVPVLQSPYGVFQYYGQLLRTNVKVEIGESKSEDKILFNVSNDLTPCFAHVNYGGSFCVPEEQASNTKEVLTVLIALVNLSTSRSSLPVTPSVLVNSTQ